MRLLFVCPDMRTGGTERVWATLIPELHDRGETVKLVTLGATGPFFDDVVARGVPAGGQRRQQRRPVALRAAALHVGCEEQQSHQRRARRWVATTSPALAAGRWGRSARKRAASARASPVR